MDLKSILKTLKLNESTISTVLGGIVILVLGIFVINYFKKLPSNQLPPALTTENTQGLITTHKVQKGETLSQIALKYYKSGDWKKIAEANSISNPDVIEVGQELKIPQEIQTPTPQPAEAEVATKAPEPTTATQAPATEETNPNEPISAATYKVVKGDSLWKIAIRAYGDGYKWVQIARENKLKNPNLIHPGNVFIIPR